MTSASLAPLAGALASTIRAVESGEPPKRVVFFLQGNGIYPEQLQPPGIEFPVEPSGLVDRELGELELPETLASLDPFRDKLTIIQGLSGRVVGPPPHSGDFGALGCYSQRKHVFGETIDAALAKANPGIFPHVGLGVSDEKNAKVIYNVSAWERGKALPTQCQPVLAYQRLFAGSVTGEARKEFDARTNILDFLGGDIRKLKKQLNGREKEKLDYYLDAVDSMGKRQKALVEAGSRVKGPLRGEESFPRGIGGFAHLEAQFDIAASALMAGLTQVATVSSGSGLGFQGIKVDGSELGFTPGPIDLHSLGHGTGFCGQEWKTLHAAIQRKHVEELAKFLTKLEETQEGNGNLLDNTVVIYLSDQADGHHPSCFEWPLMVIGDLGGTLKSGGRYLRYPWYRNSGHKTIGHLYTTLLHAVGAPRDEFGMVDESLEKEDLRGVLTELLKG